MSHQIAGEEVTRAVTPIQPMPPRGELLNQRQATEEQLYLVIATLLKRSIHDHGQRQIKLEERMFYSSPTPEGKRDTASTLHDVVSTPITFHHTKMLRI
ncbi:hypothetical protein EVAR_63983_1 [Eumeta japonica]|uniref:Uncharacterized protein n=1 Tax=Eumeta variegata TaxID=151549 RepID=A0A4C1ZE17_EUMVA|nr:hypothetical protein EVAR_63983_1 [Eumeta japonica]